jgi:hypothetical protein
MLAFSLLAGARIKFNKVVRQGSSPQRDCHFLEFRCAKETEAWRGMKIANRFSVAKADVDNEKLIALIHFVHTMEECFLKQANIL